MLLGRWFKHWALKNDLEGTSWEAEWGRQGRACIDVTALDRSQAGRLWPFQRNVSLCCRNEACEQRVRGGKGLISAAFTECHSLQWREVPEQSSYCKESQVASSQLSQESRLEGMVLWIMYGLSQGDKKWLICLRGKTDARKYQEDSKVSGVSNKGSLSPL